MNRAVFKRVRSVFTFGIFIASGCLGLASRSNADTIISGWGDQNLVPDLIVPWQGIFPTVLAGLTDVAAIDSTLHTLAVKADGTVWACGSNFYGQLGDGTRVARVEYLPVTGLSGVKAVSAGGEHSLALKHDGTVWAWGGNNWGQIGNGTRSNPVTEPTQVVGLSNIIAVQAGWRHSLALKRDGSVWAWGFNEENQLGDGTETLRTLPIRVPELRAVTAITTRGSANFAIGRNGTVWGWGDNVAGQLGDGTTTRRITPTILPTLTNIKAIVSGGGFSLALKNDGTALGWGLNHWGQLGQGTTPTRPPFFVLSPVPVVGLTDISALAAGAAHGVALKSDGTVWTWGYNHFGQIGNGTITHTNLPTPVAGITGASAIAAGANHTFALLRASALQGTIQLEGLADSAPAQEITIILQPPFGNAIARKVAIDQSGVFALTDIPANTYTVRIKGLKYLARTLPLTLEVGGAVTIGTRLLAGDVNDDNTVDFSDLNTLKNYYNQTLPPSPTYLARVDLNGDGVIDISDLLLLISNYNELGD